MIMANASKGCPELNAIAATARHNILKNKCDMEAITQPKGMYNETFHGLTTYELKLILPAIKQAYRHAEKMAAHYKDLTEDGYGTDRQCTAMFVWQEKAAKLEGIINYANKVIK